MVAQTASAPRSVRHDDRMMRGRLYLLLRDVCTLSAVCHVFAHAGFVGARVFVSDADTAGEWRRCNVVGGEDRHMHEANVQRGRCVASEQCLPCGELVSDVMKL